MNRWIRIVILAAWVVGGAGRDAMAQGEPKNYTQQDFYKELLEFNRDQMVNSYQTGGRRNPAWDAAAIAALNLLATFSAQNSTEDISALPLYPDPRVETTALAEATQKAIELGCDDPIILYAKAIALIDDGMTREARDWLDKSDAALQGTTYPPLLRLRIAYRRYRLAVDAKTSDSLWPKVAVLCTEVAGQKFMNAAAQRESARTIIIALNRESFDDFEDTLNKFSTFAKFDPWTLAELKAEIEMRFADDKRGNAWAADTLPAVMQAYDKMISEVGAAAEKAYHLHPDFPESAVMIINVQRAGGNTGAARQWFQKALDAQSDYAQAYSSIYVAMEPRWGGSIDQCMAIANRAAESNRYDTSIPFEYIVGVLNIAADAYGGDKDAFKNAEVRANAADVLNKYLAQEKNPARLDYLRACLAALHVASKEMEPARKLLDQIQGDPPPAAFRMFNLYAPRAIEQVYLATISDPTGIANFRRASSRHFYKNAGKFLDQIITRDKPKGRTADILDGLKSGTDIMLQYQAGQPVSLIDEASRGFWESEFNYKISADGVATNNFEALSRFVLPDRHYELHLKFEFDDVKATRNQNLSIAWGLDDGYVGWSLSVTGDPASLILQAPDTQKVDKSSVITMEVPSKNEIDITYFDDVPSVKFDGNPIAMDFGTRSVLEKLKPGNRILLSSNATMHFTEVTLQHLAAKP
jgi:hypothetical protein